MNTAIESDWQLAKARYATLNVDVDATLKQLDNIPVFMHC
ncbi:MAG: L-rhamnose isomerase [Symbiopectobacterium sp.]